MLYERNCLNLSRAFSFFPYIVLFQSFYPAFPRDPTKLFFPRMSSSQFLLRVLFKIIFWAFDGLSHMSLNKIWPVCQWQIGQYDQSAPILSSNSSASIKYFQKVLKKYKVISSKYISSNKYRQYPEGTRKYFG